jgi:Carboxypeptidase regulatory-like domain
MQFPHALALLTIYLSSLTTTAEVISLKTVDGKQVTCMHTGLTSDLNDCGTRSDWYSYVFVGTIIRVTPRITPAQGNEFELQIAPQEIFSGKPDNPMTVLTSQGLCLPKLVVGDRWLFYLRKEAGKPIVLDFYGNDSLPVTSAQEQVATLRHLQKIGDHAILRGRVVQRNGKPVADAHVAVRRSSDSAPFVSTTGADGRFEFQPLSPGGYKIIVPVGPHRADEIDLKPGACWEFLF